MTVARFPLRLAPVERKPRSAAQDVAFAREEIETAMRLLSHPSHQPALRALETAMAQIDALKSPNVLGLGCWRCGGDVPADQPELAKDRICPPCAADYDAAVAERRAAIKLTRKAA